MSRTQEKLLLGLVDFIAINLGTMLLLWTKHVGGILHSAEQAWQLTHGPGTAPSFLFVIEFYSLAVGLVYALPPKARTGEHDYRWSRSPLMPRETKL